MIKVIEVEKGREITFKASAFSPIQYGKLFKGHDFLRDMDSMRGKASEAEDSEEGSVDFTIEHYEMFVRLAYTFAYQGLSDTPRVNDAQKEFLKKYPTPWVWIDTFGTFSIYEILPQIVELWYGNNETMVKAKKAQPAPPAK